MNAVVTPSPGPASRSVDAGRGLAWWTEAWPLFTRQAGMWIVLSLAAMIVAIVVSLIPLLGALAVSLASPVVAGSFMLAARKVEGGGELAFGDLFAGFRDKLGPLVIIGVLVLAASLVIGMVVGVVGVGAAIGAAAGGAAHSGAGMAASLGLVVIVVVLAFAAGFVMAMAIWYAPALVVLDDMAPIAAVKASFSASLKNIGAFLVYGLIYIVVAIVASIPLGLGWIVLVPVLVLSIYVSYKDVFTH
jgi:uncharacterized membrane protein